MPPNPKRSEFPVRLPPHVYGELHSFIEDCSRHFRNEVSNSDMVGALILRVRRERRGLMDDVAAYLDVLEAWTKDGTETFPQ
jgi:hypothetical protein